MLGSITIQSVDLAYYGDHLLDFVLRLLAAALAGFIIGFERKSRSKEAGVRTHTLVAVGAAIMMILSKYAFGDMIINELGVRGADGARIAAQVVSGIGFLGAGIIVYRRDTLRGLTTAAGIWATAGLGMAFGAGMYIVGAVGTVVILGVQILLHLPIKAFHTRMFMIVHAVIRLDNEEVLSKVKEIFDVEKFLKFKTIKTMDTIQADVEIHTNTQFTAEDLYRLTQDYPFIISVEQVEEI